jgi:glycosyltransferase involved in cell wall biosynthesis
MTDGKPARHPHPFSVLRRFRKTDLTICIPAYQAGGFIDRALRCAQGQTYGHVRILVAIDRSTDATADVCRRFASEDRRIDIVEHRERLGWCGNLNSLLERVDTRFFFLYFHDDLILPQYCEHLRDALLRSPEAASANADLVNFGKVDRIDPGRSYRGSTAQRLLESMVVPEPGALLRSMVRSSTIDKDYRLPPEEEGSVTRAPMGLRMLAAGPAVRVAEALYLRWIREGGLTDGWKKSPFDRWLDGWIQNVGRAFAIIDKSRKTTGTS